MQRRCVPSVIQAPPGGPEDLPIPDTPVPGLIGNLTKAEDPDYTEDAAFKVGSINKTDVRQYALWRNKPRNLQVCPFQNTVMEADGIHKQIEDYLIHKYGRLIEAGLMNRLKKITPDVVSFPTFNCSREQWAQWPCCGTRELAGPWEDTYPAAYKDTGLPPPNSIDGTDGSAFGRNIPNDKPLNVFVDALFRTIPFDNVNGEMQQYRGLELRRYTIAEGKLKNATGYPPNAAFYMYGPDGMQNMTMVQQGLPIFTSMPHFFEAGEGTVDKIDGLNPNREDHQAYLLVEPQSGSTFVEHKRIMISLQIGPEPRIGAFLNVSEAFVPIAWFDEVGLANQDSVDSIRTLHVGELVVRLSYYVLTPIAGLAALAGLVFAFPTTLPCMCNGPPKLR